MNTIKKLMMLILTLIVSANVQASIEEAFHDMFVAVEKMQEEFSKIGDKINEDMSKLHGSFNVTRATTMNDNLLTINPSDTDLVMAVRIDDLDKDSIKAVVHNNVLTIKAHTKQKEMELVVDKRTVEVSMQQHIEQKSEDAKNKQQKVASSYSSQRFAQTLPVTVDVNEVSVEYEHGVLTIKLPRLEPVQQPKIINVIKK